MYIDVTNHFQVYIQPQRLVFLYPASLVPSICRLNFSTPLAHLSRTGNSSPLWTRLRCRFCFFFFQLLVREPPIFIFVSFCCNFRGQGKLSDFFWTFNHFNHFSALFSRGQLVCHTSCSSPWWPPDDSCRQRVSESFLFFFQLFPPTTQLAGVGFMTVSQQGLFPK